MHSSPEVLGAMVLFHPDPDLLQRALAAALAQVDALVLVDNGSAEAEEVVAAAARDPRVRVVTNPGNAGVSRALNQALRAAREIDASWLLALDQDTVCDVDLVGTLLRSAGTGTAIVCPTVADRHLGHPGAVDWSTALPAETAVDYCITSGALYNVAACTSIGGWDEDLFVDFVDFDLCLRLRVEGHTIVQRHDVVVEHSVGHRAQHRRWIADNHSSARCFHIARDMVRYSFKHRGRPRALLADGRGLLGTYRYLATKAAIVGAFEPDKARKVSALARGATVGTIEALGPVRARRSPSEP